MILNKTFTNQNKNKYWQVLYARHFCPYQNPSYYYCIVRLNIVYRRMKIAVSDYSIHTLLNLTSKEQELKHINPNTACIFRSIITNLDSPVQPPGYQHYVLSYNQQLQHCIFSYSLSFILQRTCRQYKEIAVSWLCL